MCIRYDMGCISSDAARGRALASGLRNAIDFSRASLKDLYLFAGGSKVIKLNRTEFITSESSDGFF